MSSENGHPKDKDGKIERVSPNQKGTSTAAVKPGRYKVGIYVELSVILTLFGVWNYMVRDNPMFEVTPLPANFSMPEPMTIRWPQHEITFTAKDGKKLATYSWHASGNPKGLVFFFPGYADYSENNANVAKIVVSNGYSAFGIDPPGHGRSEGLRGLVDDFNTTIDDIVKWVSSVRAKYPKGLKAFLWGNSMGAAIGLRVLLRSQEEFAGVYVGAPAMAVSEDFYPSLRQFVKLAAEWIPTFPLVPSLSDTPMCTDENIKTAIQADPLFYNGRLRPKTASEYVDNFEFLQANVHKITTPLLIFHAEKDDLITYETTSKVLYEKAASKDKIVKIIKGELHNFMQSPKYKEYAQEVVNWFDKKAQV